MSQEQAPQLHEILNDLSFGMQSLAGMIEAQRFLIEDLYAHIYSDPATFREHADRLLALPESGSVQGVDERLLRARREARDQHLRRFAESTADRIAARHN